MLGKESTFTDNAEKIKEVLSNTKSQLLGNVTQKAQPKPSTVNKSSMESLSNQLQQAATFAREPRQIMNN